MVTRTDALNKIIQETPMDTTDPMRRDLTGPALADARTRVACAMATATPALLRAVCDLNGWDTEGGATTLRKRILRERFGYGTS